MRFVYKVVLALIVLVVITGGVMGYRWYEGRTYVPTVTLPVVHDQTDGGAIVVESVATELGQLWGLDFIPGTTLLLATEKTGQLFLIDVTTTVAIPITGVPAVATVGQGGLLDIAVSPDFLSDQTLFLTYAVAGEGGSATRLASARLDIEAERLEDVTVLYTAPYQSGGTHFGARVVVRDAYVFVTLGDRGDKNFEDHTSQNTQNPYGSIIRLHRDGRIPSDNPFVSDSNVIDEIYSYGHRNPQGLALRPGTTELWSSEHGEFQGDEINRIQAGGNYGWPDAHYACSYVTRRPFGVTPEERPDTIAPAFSWKCGTSGFPPAGMVFYQGEMFRAWEGDLLVGGLASRYLARFRIVDGELQEQEPLLKAEGWRVRDVAIRPTDGMIFVAVEGGEVSLVRMRTE